MHNAIAARRTALFAFASRFGYMIENIMYSTNDVRVRAE